MPHHEVVTSSDTVVVVGAGISGAACARRLDAAGLPVLLLDRGRRAGGRMSSRPLHGRQVDLGAQYVTASEPGFRAVVDAWVERGLARPWTDAFHTGDGRTLDGPKEGPVRYGAAGGLRTLVEDLTVGMDVRQRRTVRAVGVGGAGPQGRPTVDGEPVRAVVLAMPDPQATRLLDGDAGSVAAELDHAWSPALALTAGWASRRWDVDGVFVDGGPDGALRWIADDGQRRGDGAAVLVAHSTPQLAQAHLDAPDDAQAAMVEALRGQLGITDDPEWTHVRRWRLAKPTTPREQTFALLADGRIGVCGDGWSTTPKVEAAWLSGDALGGALAAQLS